MELHEAYSINLIKKPVYGAVTSGDRWIFTKYVGHTNGFSMENWQTSSSININLPNFPEEFNKRTEEDITEVASYIKWIIKSSVEAFSKAIE